MAARELPGVLLMTIIFVILMAGATGYMLLQDHQHKQRAATLRAKELFRLAEAQARQGNPARALAHLERLIELNPDSPKVFFARAQMLQQLGDPRAIEDYTTAIDLGQDSAEVFLSLALLHEQRDEFAAAEKVYSRAIEHARDGHHVRHGRARVRRAKGDFGGAVEDLEHLRSAGEDDTVLHRDLGWAHWGVGDYDEALEPFDHVAARKGKSLHALFERGVTHYHLDQLEEARQDLERAAMLDQDGRDYVHYYLWLTLVKLGERAKADSLLGDLMQLSSRRTEMKPWSSMIARFLLGDLTEQDLLTEAHAGTWQPAPEQLCEACFYAGSLRLLQGDREIAARYFQDAIEANQLRFYEHFSAREELRKLKEKDKTVPFREARSAADRGKLKRDCPLSGVSVRRGRGGS